MQSISRRDVITTLGVAAVGASLPLRLTAQPAKMQSGLGPLATAQRTGIHDVAPAPDGGVWFSAQRSGHLGWFDPEGGQD